MDGRVHAAWESAKSEHAKTAVEFGLHHLSRSALGGHVIDLARGEERVSDPRLQSEPWGIAFENPVMVGAGWDKRGRAVDGLHRLGFAGVEVGSVLVHPQAGNPRPRLFLDTNHWVALNRLGFNSKGQEVVARELASQQRQAVVGISLGRNKLTPEEHSPWAHAAVAERLYDFADYFVINVASPNTPGLRDSLKPGPLRGILHAVQDAVGEREPKPILIKTTVDLALDDLDKVIDVVIGEEADGIVDTNTTIDAELKARYGWVGEAAMGGLSGNDPEFRDRATERMRYIYQATKDVARIERIGVGAINDGESAADRIEAGANLVQVVTAFPQRRAKLPNVINKGLVQRLNERGLQNIDQLVGISA